MNMNLWDYAAQLAKEAQQSAPTSEEAVNINPLSRQLEEPCTKNEQREICKERQEAIARSEEARTAILKGIQAGESTARLLLFAVDCIANLTGDNVFSEQSRAGLQTVYGHALQQPDVLQIELEEVRARLAMLTRPELDAEPENSRSRIQAAIRAHRQREKKILEALKAGKKEP